MTSISGKVDPVVRRIKAADIAEALGQGLRDFRAAIMVVLLIVSALPYFLGLLVTLPVLGHVTWHLYRRIVAPVSS